MIAYDTQRLAKRLKCVTPLCDHGPRRGMPGIRRSSPSPDMWWAFVMQGDYPMRCRHHTRIRTIGDPNWRRKRHWALAWAH